MTDILQSAPSVAPIVPVPYGASLHVAPGQGLPSESQPQIHLLLLQILAQLQLQKECTSTLDIIRKEKNEWDDKEEKLNNKLYDLKREKRLLDSSVSDLQFENQQLRKGKCNVTDNCADVSQKRIIEIQKQLKTEKDNVADLEEQLNSQKDEYEENLRVARTENIKAEQKVIQMGIQINTLKEQLQKLSANVPIIKYLTPADSLPLKESMEELLSYLQDNDFSVNNIISKKKWKPLHVAAAYGDPTVVDVLLNFEADINAVDESGITPLMLAAVRGKLQATQILISRDADLESKDEYGSNALHKAASQGHAAIVREILLKRSPGINVPNDFSEFPLHIAAYYNYIDTVRALLESKEIPLDSLDGKKQTPLHRAAERGNLEIVKLLVQHGTNLSTVDNAGKTTLDLASERNHPEVVQFLKERHNNN